MEEEEQEDLIEPEPLSFGEKPFVEMKNEQEKAEEEQSELEVPAFIRRKLK